jgi:hypothetical protein
VTTNGSGDGSSWANAANLQDALTSGGEVTATTDDEIWVASGVYYPDEGDGQIDDAEISTFQLIENIAIYGGFAGNEANRDDRDWQTNITVLSGDIDGNDTNTDGNNIAETWNDIHGSNAYHVVTGTDDAILDGVTITAGQADGSSPDKSGGGMYNDTSSPTLSNITFRGNQAYFSGGGMCNIASSSPTLTNVTFRGNQVYSRGGGMYNQDNSNPSLTNVTFDENQTDGSGGGMYNQDNSNPSLTNVTFDENQTDDSGGGMANNNSSPTLTNVTFSNNQADASGGMGNSNNSNPTLSDCIFQRNQATILDSDGKVFRFFVLLFITRVFRHNSGEYSFLVYLGDAPEHG